MNKALDKEVKELADLQEQDWQYYKGEMTMYNKKI